VDLVPLRESEREGERESESESGWVVDLVPRGAEGEEVGEGEEVDLLLQVVELPAPAPHLARPEGRAAFRHMC